MKYSFSKDSTNLIITLDTESGKYAPEVTSLNDPNITLENGSFWIYENGKFLRFLSFDQIITIDGVIPSNVDDAFTKLNTIINTLHLLASPKFKGTAVPTDTPTGTEDAFWIATQAGTYTNFGGVVVSANSRAEISRISGVFTISQTSLDISSKADLEVGKNKFNRNTITAGYRLSNTNVLSANAAYNLSDYIKVTPLSSYIANKNMRYVTYFNASKVYVAGGASVDSKAFTVPAGVEYVRVSLDSTVAGLDVFQLELGTSITTYEAFRMVLKSSQLDLPKYTKETDFIALSEKSFIIELGKNIFDYSTGVFGVLANTGLITASSTFKTSDFIRVLPQQQVSMSRVHNYCQYDENKVFIPNSYVSVSPQAQTTFTTDSKCIFIRIEDYYTSFDLIQVELGPTSTIFEPYAISEIKKLQNNKIVSFYNKLAESLSVKVSLLQTILNTNNQESVYIERGKNLLNPDSLLFGTLSTVGIFTENLSSNWRTSEFISIPPGVSVSINSINAYCQYDENKNFIAGTFVNNAPQVQNTFTTHANCAFIRIQDYYTSFANKQIEINSVSTAYVPYTTDVSIRQTQSGKTINFNAESSIFNFWKDKKMLCMGDSVTASLGYQNGVQVGLGLSEVRTKAKGGLGIIQIIDGDSNGYSALTASELADIDIVTFFGGLNDRLTSIGNVTDIYPAQNTVCGRYRYVIDKFYSLANSVSRKDIRIVFIAPHKVGKYGYNDYNGGQEYPLGSGQTLETFSNKLKEICGFYGIPVVDLYHNSGINDYNWELFTANTLSPAAPFPNNPDNVHPNTEGYKLISRCIAGVIKNI